jgi:hypothetical protein
MTLIELILKEFIQLTRALWNIDIKSNQEYHFKELISK